jgi:hypothetical protein
VLLVILVLVALAWIFLGSLEQTWENWRDARYPSAKPGSEQQRTSEEVKPKSAAITADVLDGGLGIGLIVYEDYHTLLDKTKDRGIEWSFTGEGNSLRLSAPGAKVYVSGKNITAYTLKFDEIFAEEHWDWWWEELARVGLTEKATSIDLTGQTTPQSRVSLFGTRSIRQNQGWATPAFELSFSQDRLYELHAGIKPGPGPEQPSTR